MFCRRVCQRLGPVVQRVFTPTFRKSPVRHMAFGVPGGSTNMTYFVLCGGGLTAAVVYAYKTVLGDSERYEDRLANMGSTAKAKASSGETVIAAAEPAPVDEPEPPVDVIAESVAAPAEPVAESTAERVVESATPEDDVGVVSEVLATEDEAEPTAVEEVPAVVAEAVPTTVEVTATEESPAEALASAGTTVLDEALLPSPPAEAETVPEAVPDLLTAVKILAGSTVEIAAASVGESSLMRAARHIEEDGKGLDSVLEVLQLEVLEGTEDSVAKEPLNETVVITNEEELDPAEVVSGDEEPSAEVKVSPEEMTTEEAPSPATDEEEEVPPEEAAPLGPTQENAGGMHAEDQNPAPDPEDDNIPEEASPEEAAPSAEASKTAEAAVDEELPVDGTSVEEAEEAEAPTEETVAASEEEGTSQSEIEVLSAAEPESNCHHDSLAEVSMPTADQPSQILEEAVDEMKESRDAVSPVEAQSPEAVVVVISQS
ncbi:fibrous sheath CABYR-binding protein [Phyllopteryx taeniolatus]|uniref:fibrous sheath CABYR-binding protein n=1 Tax=Phyllopteryx taeniolatus TaxID=161469 RepID=UPI002AD42778|nr:fibrous sheath CABYR-binding protein [Phyllopteryx taeniolatus]